MASSVLCPATEAESSRTLPVDWVAAKQLTRVQQVSRRHHGCLARQRPLHVHPHLQARWQGMVKQVRRWKNNSRATQLQGR